MEEEILSAQFVRYFCASVLFVQESSGEIVSVELQHDQRPALFGAVLRDEHKIRSSLVGVPLLLASVIQCHRQSQFLPLITVTFET